MLSRRVASRVATAGALTQQRSVGDHHRWYGHMMELDVWNYKFTGRAPEHLRKADRTEEDKEHMIRSMPDIKFCSSYEMLSFNADRLNPHLNRKEFANEIRFRLEKQANTVARAQKLVSESEPMEQAVEETMIARIADEEHVQAEMKYVKTVRANEMAEDNRLDILPGGSPNSLREKTRWATNCELHPIDRAEIQTRIQQWLPEKYHIYYFDDYQTVAANNAQHRKEMLAIVDEVEKEHAAEAKASGYEKDLEEVIAELRDNVDPTRHITSDAIKKCSSLDQLEEWSRAVHEYNGDVRMFEIYERAAALTKNPEHAELVKKMRAAYN